MNGKSVRRKGHQFERYIASRLRSIYPEAKRGLQTQLGGVISDVEIPVYHIECSKGGESIWAKWKQACNDAGKNKKIPIVVKCRDREKPIVVMDFEHWLQTLLVAKEGNKLWIEDKSSC